MLYQEYPTSKVGCAGGSKKGDSKSDPPRALPTSAMLLRQLRWPEMRVPLQAADRHIRPHALGGPNTRENLRLLCPAHNQLAAIQVFGAAKMARFIRR